MNIQETTPNLDAQVATNLAFTLPQKPCVLERSATQLAGDTNPKFDPPFGNPSSSYRRPVLSP